MKGFGISFTKQLLDVDGNQLSDLGIGSYASNEAVILKRRLLVWAKIEIEPSEKFIDITSFKSERNNILIQKQNKFIW